MYKQPSKGVEVEAQVEAKKEKLLVVCPLAVGVPAVAVVMAMMVR